MATNTTKPHVVILCAKKHEFEMMVQQVNKEVRKNSLQVVESGENASSFQQSTHRWFDSDRFRLTLFNFQPNSPTVANQGPIVAAVHTTAIILSNTEYPVTHMGMVGVCGGTKLGSVIVGWCAKDALGGRFTKHPDGEREKWTCGQCHRGPAEEETSGKEEKDRHFTLTKEPAEKYEQCAQQLECFDGWDPELDDFPFAVIKNGIFHSYPHVNDDLQSVVDDASGLEMEGYAMLHALRTLACMGHGVIALPIIKGVSDVDETSYHQGDHAEHNTQQLAAVQGLTTETPRERRRLFRQTAGENAAKVMVSFLLQCFPPVLSPASAHHTVPAADSSRSSALPTALSDIGVHQGVSMDHSVFGVMKNSSISSTGRRSVKRQQPEADG